MPTLHPTNSYNVESTLSNWFQTQLAALTAPPSIPTTAVIFNFPDNGIVPPAISLMHLPVGNYSNFQGRNVDTATNVKGVAAHGLIDISVWVSRDYAAGAASGERNENWAQDLMLLNAAVKQVFIATPTIAISDYTTAASPSATTYKINIGDCVAVPTSPDPNPAIMRQRYNVSYEWIVRV